MKADAVEWHLVALTSKGALLAWGVGPAAAARPPCPHEALVGRDPGHQRRRQPHRCSHPARIVLAWGANSHGQLGTGDVDDRALPTPIRFPRLRGRVTGISSGGGHVLR